MNPLENRTGQLMCNDNRDLLEALKFELSFVARGGYGRSVRTPQKATNAFLDSPTCLNFNDSSRPNPCSECHLMQFVPEKYRRENLPCHFIPLNDRGESVASFDKDGTRLNSEEAMATWLRATIARVEQEVLQRLD